MCYIYLAQHYKEYLGVQQNKQKIIISKIVILQWKIVEETRSYRE